MAPPRTRFAFLPARGKCTWSTGEGKGSVAGRGGIGWCFPQSFDFRLSTSRMGDNASICTPLQGHLAVQLAGLCRLAHLTGPRAENIHRGPDDPCTMTGRLSTSHGFVKGCLRCCLERGERRRIEWVVVWCGVVWSGVGRKEEGEVLCRRVRSSQGAKDTFDGSAQGKSPCEVDSTEGLVDDRMESRTGVHVESEVVLK